MAAQVFKVTARELLGKSKEEIWELPIGWYDIQFDDGTVHRSTSRRSILTWYCWTLHRMYPETPLLPQHHMRMGQMTRSMHRNIMSQCITTCRRHNGITSIEILEGWWKKLCEATNDLYNDMGENLEEYVTSISAEDIADILFHPEIKAINDHIQNVPFADEAMVTKATDDIERTLLNARGLRGNPTVRSIKCGASRKGQVLQVTGPIGHRTDVDGHIYRPAITRSYGHGMITLREMLIESRDACRNIFFQNRPMQLAEWNNRIVQIMVAILSNVHEGDCGSTEYLPVFVTDTSVLKDIRGAYMFDKEIKMLRPVEPDDYGLIGHTVLLRNITTCRHTDRYGFCSTCYGELYYSVPLHTNVGHIAPIEVLGTVGQLILSQKHYNGAATSIKFDLYEGTERWVDITNDGLSLKLTRELVTSQFTVSFRAKEVRNMLDLEETDEEEISGEQLSALSTMYITFNNGLGRETVSIRLNKARNLPVFSMEFIRYIRANGWYVNDQGNYEVDMSGWDIEENILDMPLAQFSAPMYMNLIQEFIRGQTMKGKETDNDSVLKYENLGDALIAFRNIIALKLQINITQLALILQATKIANATERDYRPPQMKSEGTPRKFNENMRYRSIVAAYAFQYHQRTVFDPMSFLITKRPPHYLDELMRDYSHENSKILTLL